MFDVELFLGFPIDETFEEAMASADSRLIQAFIQPNQDYIQKFVYQNVAYLGKSAGKISEISKLDLLSSHIYSLLKKIIPDYPYEKVPLVLFPASLPPNKNVG